MFVNAVKVINYQGIYVAIESYVEIPRKTFVANSAPTKPIERIR